jgi:hypothetical protein
MKKIKNYNNFINENHNKDISISLNLDKVNNLINNKKFIKIIKTTPEWIKSKIQKYYENNIIDINQILKIDKKYNIVKKTIDLYKKGITNIKDIYDKIFPKNESITGLIAFLLSLIFVGVTICAIYDEIIYSPEPCPLFLWVILSVLLTISSSILIYDIKNDKQEKKLNIMGYDIIKKTEIIINNKDNILYTLKDKKTDELKIVDKNGYKQILNQNDTINFNNVEEFF